MSENIKKYSDYIVIASLYKNESISVKVAFKGKHTTDNLYILNEFPFDSSNLYIFKMLFNMFHRKNKPSEFTDFFVFKHHFYAIFKYNQCSNIIQKFEKENCIMTFEERSKLLENILIKLELLKTFPKEIINCVSETNNININNKNEIYLIYNLAHTVKYRGCEPKITYENIYRIINTLLAPEIKMRFNKSLHIILDKCKQGVYSSIPELIIDLKKAEKISKNSSWKSYIKYLLETKKSKINRFKRYAMIFLIISGVLYIGYSKISAGVNVSSTENVNIGGINYSSTNTNQTDKTLSSENQDNQSTTNTTIDETLTLTKGLDIDYEDYIVKYGDTITSIATEYYKDKKYINAVASFNGIEITEKLTPGSIIKMPNKTAIALYVTK